MSKIITRFCDLCGKELSSKEGIEILSKIEFPAWDNLRAIKVSFSVKGNGVEGQLDRCPECEKILIKEYLERINV
jgi:uncharacterized protein with PIN domain